MGGRDAHWESIGKHFISGNKIRIQQHGEEMYKAEGGFGAGRGGEEKKVARIDDRSDYGMSHAPIPASLGIASRLTARRVFSATLSFG